MPLSHTWDNSCPHTFINIIGDDCQGTVLSERDKEDHFRRHTRKLRDNLERDLRALVKAAEPVTLKTTWADVKVLFIFV